MINCADVVIGTLHNKLKIKYMKKTVNVVMLPTEKASKIGLNKDKLYFTDRAVQYESQHLYIISDEEIKEGDYVYVESLGIIKCSESLLRNKDIKNDKKGKVIATTDTSLEYLKEYPCGGWDGGQLVPNVPLPHKLPLIPESFINLFIERYNEGNIIDKVEVELIDNGHEEWYGDDYNGEPIWNEKIEVTIPIPKECWSREEVITIIKTFAEYCQQSDDNCYKEIEWIGKNI